MEVVKISNYYAVRKKFLFWYRYLDLYHYRKYKWITWRSKGNLFFIDCLSGNDEIPKEALNYLTAKDEALAVDSLRR